MTDIIQSPQQLVLFDYEQIDDVETRVVVRQRAVEIRDLVRQTADNVLRIGEKLAEVRDKLRHNKAGGFEQWIRAEFSMSKTTAYSMINVFERLGNRPESGQLPALAPSVLYLLTSPNAPDEALDEALARAQAGEPISGRTAEAIIEQYREQPESDGQEEPDDTPDWLQPDENDEPEDTTGALYRRTAERQQAAPPPAREHELVDRMRTHQPPPAPESGSSPAAAPPPPPPPAPKKAAPPPPPTWHLHATIQPSGTVLVSLARQPHGGSTEPVGNASVKLPGLPAAIEQLLAEHIPAERLTQLQEA